MADDKLQQRYRLYLDESGDHVFHNESALEHIGHRYLALVGCMFRGDSYLSFHRKLEDLKQRHFPHNPDNPVILHREDIVNKRGPFRRLRDQAARIAFDNDLLDLIGDADYRTFAVVIDKLELKRKYPDPFHPYHMALGFMLQRYCGYLNHINRCGDILAESRGGREDRLLKNAYSHIYTHGDMHHKADFFGRALSSKELKLKKKDKNIAGLQLADLLAHPGRQQILFENGRLSGAPGLFGSKIAETAETKYNRHLYSGKVEGYGKVLFPK